MRHNVSFVPVFALDQQIALALFDFAMRWPMSGPGFGNCAEEGLQAGYAEEPASVFRQSP
jgi:hypothetical protein